MDSNEIRTRFLDFFAARGHEVVPSASLIPVDPTLLLNGAGMVPFKPYFLGEEPAPYPRAASIQKVARTTDIEVVGSTTRHLTFFEMLGNFSFGDYFKADAIPWAYELVTEQFGLDPDRLWYTVYDNDDEAAEIWIEGVGVPPERVQRGGTDNFWQMGVAGPCGPSSEIFVDRGEHYGPEGGPIGGGEERYAEIWNLVFMQNIQDTPYHVVGDLPAKNIDTGAGLERVAMVLQDVGSVFEADTVKPILEAGAAATGTRYGADSRTDVSLRIMADHGRALTFLIGDGVVPSNDGRGYILRRLIRRAVRHAWGLGGTGLVTPRLVAATVDVMADAYPELVAQRDFITDMTTREEERFRHTLESGQRLLLDELAGREPGSTLPGTVAFKLHDTFGFPFEITREMAAERGFGVDRDGFELAMEDQKARARAAWKGGEEARVAELYRRILESTGPTEFVGYDLEASPGRILTLMREGETLERAGAGEEVEVFLDRTPFYAESGGQVGDSGVMTTPTGTLRVYDTTFPVPGLNGSRARVEDGYVMVGQEVDSEIDADRRERIRKSHTGTHILHWALREVLGHHARQAGSLVEAGRLRFDFSHYTAPTAGELVEAERLANERIIENATVRAFQTSRKEAEKLGALAFFGDKYGEVVRVVEAGSYSRELCGGTHTPSTGQVGPLIVTSEGSIGSNLRRVEALTGSAAYGYLADLRRQLTESAAALRTQPGDLVRSVHNLLDRTKAQEARIGELEDRFRADDAAALAARADKVGTALVVVDARGDTTPDALRMLAQQVRDRLDRGIVVLGAIREGKGTLVAAVHESVAREGIGAADILAPAARILGGGGSRDPLLAQAGGPHGDRLPEALTAARDEATRLLTG